jgi:hypothetical protein
MAVIVKKTGQLSKISDLKAHIKYIGFRSQEIDKELKDGRFFSDKFDNVNYKTFLNGIENNKALQHPKSIKGHKLVFSLNQREYEAYLKSGKDYKDIIRKVLSDYEKEKNLKLDWVGSIHLVDGKGKSNHPHCHVVISGVSKPDKDGKVTRVKFYKDDFKSLRSHFDNEIKKEIGTLEHEFKNYEKGDNFFRDISKGFEMVAKEIQKEAAKEQYRTELLSENEKERRAKKERKARER